MIEFKYTGGKMLPPGVTIVPCEFINEDIIKYLDEEGCDTSEFYLYGDYLYVRIFGSRHYMQIEIV